jgi:hypothetical protein
VRVDFEKTAFPPESETCPNKTVPSMKLTTPDGTAPVPLVLVTVAVKVTVVP